MPRSSPKHVCWALSVDRSMPLSFFACFVEVDRHGVTSFASLASANWGSLGCRDGAVVRALASHQFGPASIPRQKNERGRGRGEVGNVEILDTAGIGS